LQISVSANKSRLTTSEPLALTIRLKNSSAATLVIPAIDPGSEQTYLAVNFTADGGKAVLFLPAILDSASDGALAFGTRELHPGEEVVFTKTFNENGIGPFVFTPPAVTSLLPFV